ncbi:MAG: YajQ family cyclic di-GMP-binding protein [Gammaproteobacteria bacterium]|nr:YajQ family cyclic di-GMP-binding protein [Gammaproteobacteria bacterium]
MPAFDVVSEVDLQEVRNAVDQASRELRSRFDFRGVDASFELSDHGIQLAAFEDFQLKQMEDMLRAKMASRKIDAASLDAQPIEGAGKQRRQLFRLKQGIDRDSAKRITKLVKDSKRKVQAQINGEKVRVTGKKRDDLQAVIALLKDAELEVPLQFDNFRD